MGTQLQVFKDPKTTKSDFVHAVKVKHGYDINITKGCAPKRTSTVYRAKSVIMDMNNDNKSSSYAKIHHFLYTYAERNSDAVVSLQHDKENQFLRCFMSSPIACKGTSHCWWLLGADGAHFVNPEYNGVLLSLQTRDGNGKTMLLAIAIVPKENEENWVWFLCLAMKSGVEFSNMAFFTDRDKGVIAAILTLAGDGLMVNL